ASWCARYSTLLADAVLSVDDASAVGGSHAADRMLAFLHCRADTNSVVQRIVGCGIAPQRKILFAECDLLQGTVDSKFDLVYQSRTFADVIRCPAGFDCLNRRFIIIDGSDQDYSRIRRDLVGIAQHLHAIDSVVLAF